MPSRAPRVCGHCGGVHQSGERCGRAVAADQERKARHDAKRPSARQRGYTAEWQRARADFLTIFSSCKRCGNLATTVDHIIPHKGDEALFWDRRNWQPLCTPCHSGAKQSEERRSIKGSP